MKSKALFALILLAGCHAEPVPEVPTRPASADVTPVAAPSRESAPGPEAKLSALPPGFVCIAQLEGISLDLRYRTSNNFVQSNLYGDYHGCYLHEDAATKLEKAASLLQAARPGWKLRVLDALRPREIQKRMFAKVKGTSSSKYVADPRDGSGHNYGMSVDVTLEDASGNEIDMGTSFDDFTQLAQPRYEAANLRSGKLTKEQYDNRQLLRSIMKQAGFNSLKQEWWHFNARGMKTIKSRYNIVEHIP